MNTFIDNVVMSGVDHPIDLPENFLDETQEEREWRVEQDTLQRKEINNGNI
jgi:hypothetical protein